MWTARSNDLTENIVEAEHERSEVLATDFDGMFDIVLTCLPTLLCRTSANR